MINRRKFMGYWTFNPDHLTRWISVLIEKNIEFWMTARRGECGEIVYILQTQADKKKSKILIDEYGFYNEYPWNEKESPE